MYVVKYNHIIIILYAPPPPPPNAYKGGRMRVPLFSGKGEYLQDVFSGRFHEKTRESGCLLYVIANGNQYPR